MSFKLYKIRAKIARETHLKFGEKYLYSYVNGEKNGWLSILGFKVGWTKERLFSVRHGYTKSIKIKDYYFTLK